MATSTILPTPLGRRVKIVEQGAGTPVVFLHTGVGSAGEWKQAFSLWPESYRLVAVEAYRDGTGPGEPGRRSLDDYADQVYAAAEHVGDAICLVGFSWGGATALRVAEVAPEVVEALAVVEPEAYALLRSEDAGAYAEIVGLRDTCRAHTRAGRWYEAFEEFIDFYNGTGTFAHWPQERQEAFLALQRARGDLWDVLFDGVAVDDLTAIAAPTHVIEGSRSSVVDHAICDVVRSHVPKARHDVIAGAGHMMPLTHPGQLSRALLSRMPR
jgi:pimeloyl-ACP methyl ester carboxylesterase